MLANSPATDPKAVGTKIRNTLDQIELCIKKQCLISDVLEQETISNEELFVDIDHMLDKNTERMEQVKEELANAKQETVETLKNLQSQLDEDQEKQQQLEQKLVERRKNMYSLAILLNNLEEEEDIVDALDTHASDEGEAME
uniref:Uncharacterized protein n=1 Tax=Ditylenchus dipsaci TaxID=166011 RepID=A0A915E2W5_9BILA